MTRVTTRRADNHTHRLAVILLLVAGGSACTSANKFLNYPTRAFREITGQKTRGHRAIPIREDLSQYKVVEVWEAENLVGDQLPPQLVDRLNSSLYRHLSGRHDFSTVVQVKARNGFDTEGLHDQPGEQGSQQIGEMPKTLVLETYVDNYHPGNKFLRLVEVGVRQAYVTLRYRLTDKVTGAVLGAGSVTVDDFRTLATKMGLINKAASEVTRQLHSARPEEISRMEKLEEKQLAGPSLAPAVIESRCQNEQALAEIQTLAETRYKPARGSVSFKGELLGGEFRVVTAIPFSGDFSKYTRIEIPKLQSVIGRDIAETVLAKYTTELQKGFAKVCRFDQVLATDRYNPAEARAARPTAVNPTSSADQTSGSLTDVEPLEAPMLAANQMAIKDAQRITRQQASLDASAKVSETLVLVGEVIDYARGNRGLQLLAPLNLGSSVLSVRLTYYDKNSGEIVGRQVITGLTEGRMLAGPLGIRTPLTAVSEGVVDQVTRRTLAGEK